MYQIETEVIIEAPVSRVWSCFLDKSGWHTFSDFRDLSPSRAITEGQPFWFALRIYGLPFPPLRVDVVRCDPEQEVRWRGGIPALPLFTGEHYFLFRKIAEEQTRLIHGERFSGPGAFLFMRMMGEKIRTIYEAFNSGLKHKVEQA